MQWILTVSLAMLAFASSGFLASDDPPSKAQGGPKTTRERFETLLKEREEALQAFRKAYLAAKTDGERQKVREEWSPRIPGNADRFLEIARQDLQGPVAVEALTQAVALDAEGPVGEEAVKLLLNHHVKSPKLGPVIFHLSFGGPKSSEKFLRAVLQQNPYHEIQGWACHSLAANLRRRSESDRNADTALAASEEAEALYQRMSDQYSDVRGYRETLGDAARRNLREVRHHGIGKPAPEITGEDIDGKEFKLSDFKGRVVVLNFWKDEESRCRAMYPHERSLVKKLEGKPFALLGINSDRDKGKLKGRMKEENITWRSWWDDGDTGGPIATAWNVHGWPTLYILDHEGIIRHKFVGFPGPERFDSALDALLDAATKGTDAQGAAAPKSGSG
jgi:peroxiredoxin